MKVTPDTDTRIKINASSDGIDPGGVKWIVSPYDMFAVEEAIQTKESLGGEVILFSAGEKSTITQLRGGGLALGADRAVLITDPAVLASDCLGTARSLAAAVQQEDCQLVFCGKQAIDDDNVQVPAMLSELLGWAQVSFVSDFETDGSTFKATRSVGGGTVEVVTGNLPVVITADKGLNTPRYAKLPAIMKAKRKPVAELALSDIGLSADDVAPVVTTSNYGLPPERPKGRFIEGDTDQQVSELVRLLREEAKVI
jgi:electron transfer flavoprotein beta subunit